MTVPPDFLTGVSTVGFPIVAYVMMWRLVTRTIEDQTEALRELKSEVES